MKTTLKVTVEILQHLRCLNLHLVLVVVDIISIFFNDQKHYLLSAKYYVKKNHIGLFVGAYVWYQINGELYCSCTGIYKLNNTFMLCTPILHALD